MSKDHLLAKIVLSEARAGNLLPLMARISSGRLMAPEREFIVDFLERREGKRTKAELHRIEQDLIRSHVEGLIGPKMPTEAAVAQVINERGWKRSTVFKAMKESKERKSKRRNSKRRESK